MFRWLILILLILPSQIFSQAISDNDDTEIKLQALRVVTEFENKINKLISSDLSDTELKELISSLTDSVTGILDNAITLIDDSKPRSIQASMPQNDLSPYFRNLNSAMAANSIPGIRFENKQAGEIKLERGYYYVNVYFKTVFNTYYKENRNIVYEPILKFTEIELEWQNGKWKALILGIYEADDFDKDWIADSLDQCQFTEPNVRVNSSGCPEENTTTQVEHKQCRNTPIGCITNSYGCPTDTDGDGVCDGLDECPNTRRGSRVDDKGCIETGKENQENKRCEETPLGCITDRYDCPVDNDKDGVCDGLDRCPDTPEKCRVNIAGCPLDDDGDGICNTLDQCPNTPINTKVSKSGCQKKSENYELQKSNEDDRFCATLVIQDGGSFLGADFEVLVGKRIGLQAGAGLLGFETNLNYHLKPTIRSSAISLVYWHSILTLRSYTSSTSSTSTISSIDKLDVIGTTFMWRGKRWLTGQLGIGYLWDEYEYFDSNGNSETSYFKGVTLLFSIGVYIAW